MGPTVLGLIDDGRGQSKISTLPPKTELVLDIRPSSKRQISFATLVDGMHNFSRSRACPVDVVTTVVVPAARRFIAVKALPDSRATSGHGSN